ncbi:MAG: glycosyltransferase [Bacteroidia bacterium]
MDGISIIIVNYNSGNFISECVTSIIDAITVPYEIIIWDNNSTDNSMFLLHEKYRHLPQLITHLGKENLGFAKGNNRAAELAKYEYFHFLNPDTLVNAQLNREYELILSYDSSDIYVNSLLEKDGSLLVSKHLLPLFGNYMRAFLKIGERKYWNIGASLIMKKSTFENIGRWPEDYFMYTEDMEVFYVADQKNIPVRYLDTKIVHIGKVSSGNRWSDLQRLLVIERSFKHFYFKYNLGYQYYLVRNMQLLYILFKEPSNFVITLKAFLQTGFRKTSPKQP